MTPIHNKEGHILILNLCLHKGHNEQKLLKEFSSNGTSEVFGGFWRTYRHGTVDRHPGSGRLRTAHTAEDVDLVDDSVSSTRSTLLWLRLPETFQPAREISRKNGIRRS